MPHGIMFHHFCDTRHPQGQGALTADQFAQVIEHLGPKNFLPSEKWFEKFKEGKLSEKDLCLTFDDGLLCQFEVALPVLESFDLTAFWFVYSSVFEGSLEKLEIYRYYRTVSFETVEEFYRVFHEKLASIPYSEEADEKLKGFVPQDYLTEFPFYTPEDRLFRYVRDKVLGPSRYFEVMDKMIESADLDLKELAKLLWMNDDHLRELSLKNHVIGLHSYSHPTELKALSRDQQRKEYLTNKSHLEKVTGFPTSTMAHPCNSYNEDTLEILQEMGVQLGFCSNLSKQSNHPLEVPREDHANVVKGLKMAR